MDIKNCININIKERGGSGPSIAFPRAMRGVKNARGRRNGCNNITKRALGRISLNFQRTPSN